MGAGASHAHAHTEEVVPIKHEAETSDAIKKTDSQKSLASRRSFNKLHMKPLRVSTRPIDILSRITHIAHFPHGSHGDSGKHKRHITWTNNFQGLYKMGEEVMPSGHSSMWIHHALRIRDGNQVVVKIRHKRGSFVNPADEVDWRLHTEFMLNLSHCNSIARLYDVFEDNQMYYIVMEKVEGMDLFETLDFHGRLPKNECREIIRQLLAAVAELHEKGYIHKDLKLENVMVGKCTSERNHGPSSWSLPSAVPGDESDSDPGLSPRPTVKLIDFDTCEKCTYSAPPKTVVGTDQYIAQEAYAGQYSPASDIFAVGVIAYRLLTGSFPFNPGIFDDVAGENWVGSPKMYQIQDRLRHFEINWSVAPFTTDSEALDLCKSMLAINQGDRPKAAAALKHEFFTHHGGSMSPRLSKTTSGKSWPGSIASASTAASPAPRATNQSPGFASSPAQ